MTSKEREGAAGPSAEPLTVVGGLRPDSPQWVAGEIERAPDESFASFRQRVIYAAYQERRRVVFGGLPMRAA